MIIYQAKTELLRGAHHRGIENVILDDMRMLLADVPPNAQRAGYADAVVNLNVLGRPTKKTRSLVYKHMKNPFDLDPATPLFRVLRRIRIVNCERISDHHLSLAETRATRKARE